MIYLLHGENTIKSYQRLIELQEKYKTAGLEINVLEAAKVNKVTWEQFLSQDSLFSASFLVISNFSGNKEIDFSLLDLFDGPIILYERKKLSTLPKIKNLVEEKFDPPSVMFKFVESIAPGNALETIKLFQETIADQPVEVVMVMLVRQIRMLMLAKSDSTTGPSEWTIMKDWQKGKIMSQAKKFELYKLKNIYSNLLKIDFEIKTGKSPVKLETRLELLLLSI